MFVDIDSGPRRLRRLQSIYGGEDIGTVSLGIHPGKNLCDLSGGVDQERISLGELHDSEIAEGSIQVGHFVVGIGQKFEIEAFFSAELLVGFDAVEAHSENNSIAFGVLRLIHLELVGFARSARSLIFGIEIKNDPFTTVVLETDETVLRGQGEVRSHAALGRLCRARQQARDYQDRNHDDYYD